MNSQRFIVYLWSFYIYTGLTSTDYNYHDFRAESNYTRLRHVEEDWEERDEVNQASKYLFGGETCVRIADFRAGLRSRGLLALIPFGLKYLYVEVIFTSRLFFSSTRSFIYAVFSLPMLDHGRYRSTTFSNSFGFTRICCAAQSFRNSY